MIARDDVAKLIGRNRAACVGKPAKIRWPHRLLHDNIAALEAQQAEIAELRGEKTVLIKAYSRDQAEIARLREAGRDTANVCFNIGQGHSVGERERESASNAATAWDSVIGEPKP